MPRLQVKLALPAVAPFLTSCDLAIAVPLPLLHLSLCIRPSAPIPALHLSLCICPSASARLHLPLCICPSASAPLRLQQLVMGRGPISSRFDTSSTGWVFGMQYRNYQKSLVFRVGAINEAGGVSVAGGVSQHPFSARLTFSSASMFPVGLTNGSASPRRARSAPFWNVLPAYFNVTTQPYIGPWGMNRALACSYTVSCDSGYERNWQNPAEAVFYPITSSCECMLVLLYARKQKIFCFRPSFCIPVPSLGVSCALVSSLLVVSSSWSGQGT